MRAVVVRALRYLGNAHPTLRPTAEMIGVWEQILSDLSDEEIWRAAEGVARREFHGAPTAAAMLAEIRGVERVVRVRVRDLYNHYRLNPDQSHVTEAVTVRWFPDGREEPVKLPPHRDSGPLLGGGLGSIRDDLDGLLGGELEC